MNIFIFASLKNKKVLQQCLDWSNKTKFRFQMTFSTNEKEILRSLHKFNGLVIVVNNDKASKILKKHKIKFITVTNDWYSKVKHEH